MRIPGEAVGSGAADLVRHGEVVRLAKLLVLLFRTLVLFLRESNDDDAQIVRVHCVFPVLHVALAHGNVALQELHGLVKPAKGGHDIRDEQNAQGIMGGGSEITFCW